MALLLLMLLSVLEVDGKTPLTVDLPLPFNIRRFFRRREAVRLEMFGPWNNWVHLLVHLPLPITLHTH